MRLRLLLPLATLLSSCSNPLTFKARLQFSDACQAALEAQHPSWVVDNVGTPEKLLVEGGRRSAALTASLSTPLDSKRVTCVEEEGRMRVEKIGP